MWLEVPYGAQTQTVHLDEDIRFLGTLEVAPAPALADVPGALDALLMNPIGQGGNPLDRVNPGDAVAIVVSDHCRKTSIDRLLPRLLQHLETRGVRAEDIRFLVATGSHRAPTPAELAWILGESVWKRFHTRVYPHDPRDPENLELVGETTRGTPVWINRRALDADHLIVTGAVVLHYFGGFGGGRKSIVPGLAGLETIARNHAMNLHPERDELDPRVAIGQMAGNPVAEDMLEAATMVPVSCLINTVLNQELTVAGLFVGDLEHAHAEACAFAQEMYAVPIAEEADLVIAASPHTGNFVQTHKALYNAFQAVKPNGRIVLAAPCPEGLGGEQFAQWLGLGSPEAIITELRKRAEINGQTALSTRQKSAITLFVTEMDDAAVSQLGGRRADSVAAAVSLALQEIRADGNPAPTLYSMPAAAYTVPFLDGALSNPSEVS